MTALFYMLWGYASCVILHISACFIALFYMFWSVLTALFYTFVIVLRGAAAHFLSTFSVHFMHMPCSLPHFLMLYVAFRWAKCHD